MNIHKNSHRKISPMQPKNFQIRALTLGLAHSYDLHSKDKRKRWSIIMGIPLVTQSLIKGARGGTVD